MMRPPCSRRSRNRPIVAFAVAKARLRARRWKHWPTMPAATIGGRP